MRDDRPDVATLLVTRGTTLQRAAYLLTGDWIVAEDLLGTTLSRTLPKWGRLGYDDPFLGVLGELVQTWSVRWRRRWAPRPGEDDALARLSRRQRAVAVLVLHVGLPESRVATLLDVSVTTVAGLLGAVTSDPRAVAALAELADDESPPAPRDRVGTARREAGRRRRRWTAAVGVVAVLVAAGIVKSGRDQPALAHRASHRTVTWQLPWPDQRSSAVDRATLDGAVAAWALHGNGPIVPPITWFVGTTIAHGHDVVAVFEAAGVHGHRLVAAWAPTAGATRFHDGRGAVDPWTLYDTPAPFVRSSVDGGSARAPVISFYVPQRHRHAPVTDWVVALTAPVARTIAIDSPTGSLVASLRQGFGTVALPGPVTGPATVLASGTPDRQLIGLPGDPASALPVLSAPHVPALPAGFQVVGRLSDVGRSVNDLGPGALPSGRIVFAVRCLGSSPLSVSIGVTRHRVGTADCNGRTHLLTDVRSVTTAAPQELVVDTGSSTSYTLAFGIRAPGGNRSRGQ
jgi:hypothetical protein